MKRSSWLPQLCILLLTLATYWPIVRNDFVDFDDPQWISGNSLLVKDPASAIRYYAIHPIEGLYVPLAYVWWGVLAAVSSRPLNPAVFHAGSMLLHAVNVLLVYAILRKLVKREWPVAIGAAVFAVHPVQVETVAWASGAKDLLAGTFVLIAIWQQLANCVRTSRPNPSLLFSGERIGGPEGEFRNETSHAASSANKGERGRALCPLHVSKNVSNREPQYEGERGRFAAHSLFAVVAMALGMLAKPVAVVTPVILFCIDLGLMHKTIKQSLRRIWPMLLLSIPCIIWSRMIQTAWSSLLTPLWIRPLIAADAVAFYLVKIVWPTSLTYLYGRTPGEVIQSGAVYYAWLIPTTIAVVLWLLRRRTPVAGIGATVFVAGLLPVLGLTPFMFQLLSTVADHYLYLPMLGIAIVAASVTNLKDAAPTRAAALVVVLVLAGLSMLQLRTWRDSIALFSRAVQLHPQIPAAHANLASALASAGRIDEAIPHFKFVADALPDNAMAQQRLAQAYLFAGQSAPAIEHAEASLRLHQLAGQDAAWDHILLARALVGIDRLPEALEHLSRAAQLRPGDANTAAERDALRARLASPATTQ
jgi:hypothetical protein